MQVPPVGDPGDGLAAALFVGKEAVGIDGVIRLVHPGVICGDAEGHRNVVAGDQVRELLGELLARVLQAVQDHVRRIQAVACGGGAQRPGDLLGGVLLVRNGHLEGQAGG